ncbi:MAG: NADH-quinone oxidoreductase subunit L [Bacteroidales bacterium]
MELILWIILVVPLLPLLGFIFLSFLGKRIPKFAVSYIPTFIMAISMLCAWSLAIKFFFVEDTSITFKTDWLSFSRTLQINMGVELNKLTILMIVVVSTISFMVHLYSIAYMKGEERLSAYFSYLQLFTFSMLGLVLSINLFQLYFFWELVGLSSFLLIGFYYKRKAATAAANKAFIVTRFADFAMLLGILVLGTTAQSFDFTTLINNLTSPQFLSQTHVSFLGLSSISWGALLVFIGGAGKSALFPLHIWLPDAMEGPTPVSALIHAATMVVAGVFLIARLFPIYSISAPDILLFIAYIGSFSYLFAALIACVQDDFKKVLAYSTLSQIAYMFLALGAGGYTESLFHLFTHAFFKAALFLCAGVIIHALGSGKLANLGGLRRSFPITHIVFLVAAFSISGVPLFAGFFSKEAILHVLYPSHPVLFVMALFTGGLSAFYMFRLYFMVFYNKKAEVVKGSTLHNEPWQMAVPLLFLGLFSIVAGYLNFGIKTHIGFAVVPVCVAVVGISMAFWLYRTESLLPKKISGVLGQFYHIIYKKFYIDEIYLFFAKTIMIGWVGGAAVWCEKNIILRVVEGVAWVTEFISERTKEVQSGRIQAYCLYFLGGILTIISLLLIQFIKL